MTLDLRLEYLGGGHYRTLGKLDFDLSEAQLEHGERVRVRVTKLRSLRQNAYFHALIDAAFENQRGGPKLESPAHLKSWLLIEAGHCDLVSFSIGKTPPLMAALVCGGFAKVVRQRFDYVGTHVDTKRNEIVMKFAKSVSFAKCDAEAMAGVVDKVVSIICTEIVPGCDPEALLNMAKERAA